ncbi:hypothetical protein V6N11_001446 [Hibiscus sabdariffa]|uniref:Uncharacterized protein n=1 Tax=Hibiscus sabdariffa TaxID=183260 RepID=A0ABR2S0K9_9ROSI
MAADMVDEADCWDYNRLSQWLPHNVLDKIATVKPPRSRVGADAPSWRWEKNLMQLNVETRMFHRPYASLPHVGCYGSKDVMFSLAAL